MARRLTPPLWVRALWKVSNFFHINAMVTLDSADIKWAITFIKREIGATKMPDTTTPTTNIESGEVTAAAPQPRRYKMLMVNPPDFMALFKKGMKYRASWKVIKGLPADATLAYVSYDHMRAAVVFVVESAEFPEIPVGTVPPPIAVSIEVGGKKK